METIGSALIYGTSFDSLSFLLTINSLLQLRGEKRECQEEEKGKTREERSLGVILCANRYTHVYTQHIQQSVFHV